MTERRFLAIIVNSDRFNNATPQNGKICSWSVNSSAPSGCPSSGQDTSTARKPGERSEGDHGHADGEFDSETTGFGQSAAAGGALEF